MIYVIDDDLVMAKCIARATRREAKIFSNAIEAMNALAEGLPEIILMEVLLPGPDGFTFLNELVSYSDTAVIPVVIVSSLDFAGKDLSQYGVVGIVNKDTMLPEEIKKYVDAYA